MILLLYESEYERNFINSLRNSNNTDIAAFIDCTKKKKIFFKHQRYVIHKIPWNYSNWFKNKIEPV